MNFEEFDNFSFRDKISLLKEWQDQADFDNLIMSLQDDNIEVSGKASEFIVSLGKPAIEILIKNLSNKNVEIRSKIVFTLGQLENQSFKIFANLIKTSLIDPNIHVKKRAFGAIINSCLIVWGNIKEWSERILYYIFISIFQVVSLIFLALPLMISINAKLKETSLLLADISSIILISSVIPIISSIAIALVVRIKDKNTLIPGIIGLIQVLPYNVTLFFLTGRIDVVNSLVFLFGYLGGILGNNIYNQQKRKYLNSEESFEQEDTKIIDLIIKRIKASRQYQDKTIIISSIIGFILLVFLAISIYNISSISTNKKKFDPNKYIKPFPSVDYIDNAK